mmetsp:Transcript_49853/g.69196  ORF Transcript_49853/g.69196 Transcript_49853/m.69196 type:complete len:266 (+) Transcript_49853:192-989(+)
MVSLENWLHVAKTAISCGRIASLSSTQLPRTEPSSRSRWPATASSSSITTSFWAQSRRPKSLSNVRSRTSGRTGRSERATQAITIFVTASQPTFGCLASCCTNLSDATPTLTSPAKPESAVRSISVGKIFAKAMFRSRPERLAASCCTESWQSSTAQRKTRRSAPTGNARACCIARQMPANASALWAACVLSLSALQALPNAFSAAMTTFSSPFCGAVRAFSTSCSQEHHEAKPEGTSQELAVITSTLCGRFKVELSSTSSGSFR